MPGDSISPMIYKLTLEECLRAIENKVALIAYLAALAIETEHEPSGALFEGISDVCNEIEEMVRETRKALKGDALSVEIRATWR